MAPVSKESIGRRAYDRWQGNSSDTGWSQYNLVTNPGGSGGWDVLVLHASHQIISNSSDVCFVFISFLLEKAYGAG